MKVTDFEKGKKYKRSGSIVYVASSGNCYNDQEWRFAYCFTIHEFSQDDWEIIYDNPNKKLFSIEKLFHNEKDKASSPPYESAILNQILNIIKGE